MVFGIGNDLFGTEVIESNEPVWNQEANLLVNKISNVSAYRVPQSANIISGNMTYIVVQDLTLVTVVVNSFTKSG